MALLTLTNKKYHVQTDLNFSFANNDCFLRIN